LLALARGMSFPTGKFRSCKTWIISCPTAPVTPRTATVYSFILCSSLLHEAVVKHPDGLSKVPVIHAEDDVQLVRPLVDGADVDTRLAQGGEELAGYAGAG